MHITMMVSFLLLISAFKMSFQGEKSRKSLGQSWFRAQSMQPHIYIYIYTLVNKYVGECSGEN